MGFIRLNSSAVSTNNATGKAVLDVIASVGQPNSEWSHFKADPKGWLFEKGYVHVNPANNKIIGDGRLPDDLEIVIVEDTPVKMHVRIPFHGDVDTSFKPKSDNYGKKFPVFMARYFMRRCR